MIVTIVAIVALAAVGIAALVANRSSSSSSSTTTKTPAVQTTLEPTTTVAPTTPAVNTPKSPAPPATTTSSTVAIPQALDCTGGTPSVKPVLLGVACGDGSASLGNLSWNTWTPLQASATGTYNVDSCLPNCAQGTFHKYPALIQLSKPAPTSYGFLFSQMFVQPESGDPFQAFTTTIPG